MSKLLKPSLKLISGERRKARRSKANDLVELIVGKDLAYKCELTSYTLGRIAMSVDEPAHIKLGTQYDIQVKNDDKLIVSGNWKLTSLRPEGKKTLISFEHSQFPIISSFEKYCLPDLFLKQSRYRLFSFSTQSDLELINKHLTEVKDFPVQVPCRIHREEKSVFATFDFSSERSNLDVLEFSTKFVSEFRVGEKIDIEYDFLGTRYIFSTSLNSTDSDFDIIEVALPAHILAVTARHYDRYKCEIPAMIRMEKDTVPCKIINGSATGCYVVFENSHAGKVGEKVSISEKSNQLDLEGVLVSFRPGKARVKFLNRQPRAHSVAKFLRVILPEDVVFRSPDLYSKFLELYKKVGYSEPDNEEKWRNATVESWRIQDEIIPGSCTGGLEGDSVISSQGTIPWGTKVAYLHSVCMIKTAKAAITLLTQTTFSLAAAEIYSNIEFYSASYAKRSRFTTRLHTAFELNPHPDRQTILHTQQLFPNEKPVVEASRLCLLEISEADLMLLDKKVREIFELISDSHSAIKDVLKVSTYVGFLKGAPDSKVLIIKNDRPDRFTAANIFGITWIFSCTDNVSLATIVKEIRLHPLFLNSPFEVVNQNGSENFPDFGLSDVEKPAFFTFTHKDDFGPILASLFRAFYSIFKKYGPEAMSELGRFL